MGLVNLQNTVDGKRNAGADHAVQDPGNSDEHSDSGIGLGSDAEMEVDPLPGPLTRATRPHAQVPQHTQHRTLPPPVQIPLYQPPQAFAARRQTHNGEVVTASPQALSFGWQPRSRSPPTISPTGRRGSGGFRIEEVLSE